jgi:hypothetical protein
VSRNDGGSSGRAKSVYPKAKAKLGRQEGRKVEPLGAVFSAACQLFLMANRAYGWARCLLHDARLNTFCGFWTRVGVMGATCGWRCRGGLKLAVVARKLAGCSTPGCESSL